MAVQDRRAAGGVGAGPHRIILVVLIGYFGEDVAGADLGGSVPGVLEVGADGHADAAVGVLLREGVGRDVGEVGVGPVVTGRVSVVVYAPGEAFEEVVVDGDVVRADHTVIGQADVVEVLPVGDLVGGHVIALPVKHAVEVVVVDLDAVGVVDADQLGHVGQTGAHARRHDVGVGIRAVQDEVAEADVVHVLHLDGGNFVPDVAAGALVPFLVAGSQKRTVDLGEEKSFHVDGFVSGLALHPEVGFLGKIKSPVRGLLGVSGIDGGGHGKHDLALVRGAAGHGIERVGQSFPGFFRRSSVVVVAALGAHVVDVGIVVHREGLFAAVVGIVFHSVDHRAGTRAGFLDRVIEDRGVAGADLAAGRIDGGAFRVAGEGIDKGDRAFVGDFEALGVGLQGDVLVRGEHGDGARLVGQDADRHGFLAPGQSDLAGDRAFHFRAVDSDKFLDLGVLRNRDRRVELEPGFLALQIDFQVMGGNVVEGDLHAVFRLTEVKGGGRNVEVLGRHLADPETAAGHFLAGHRVDAPHGAAEQKLAVFRHCAGRVAGRYRQLGGVDHRGSQNRVDDLEIVDGLDDRVGHALVDDLDSGTAADGVDDAVVAHHGGTGDRDLQFEVAVNELILVRGGLHNADLA